MTENNKTIRIERFCADGSCHGGETYPVGSDIVVGFDAMKKRDGKTPWNIRIPCCADYIKVTTINSTSQTFGGIKLPSENKDGAPAMVFLNAQLYTLKDAQKSVGEEESEFCDKEEEVKAAAEQKAELVVLTRSRNVMIFHAECDLILQQSEKEDMWFNNTPHAMACALKI